MTNYPVRVIMRSAELQELESCEYGSYEDHILGDGTREEPYDKGRLHIVELIQRSPYKTIVELTTQEEVCEFYGAALSGTFGLYCLGTCQRIYNKLNPLIEDRSFADRITYGGLGF